MKKVMAFMLMLCLLLSCCAHAKGLLNMSIVLDEQLKKVRVVAIRQYKDGGESLTYGAKELRTEKWIWTREISSDGDSELSRTEAILNPNAGGEILMIYNAGQGLYALDPHTGTQLWSLEGIDLGGSISWVLGEDGTAYIAGYNGPEPTAISAEGELLWQADSGLGLTGIVKLEIVEEGLRALYENGDASGYVLYDLEGNMIASGDEI